MAATKSKPVGAEPRHHPEKKFGPFQGGCGLAIWLNEVKTDQGLRYFRSVTIQPRRYRDRKTGKWKDAVSLRPSDLPALMLAMEIAQQYISSTPLPGDAIDGEDAESLADGEIPNESPAV
jgi:hypothetical protein